MCAGRDHESAVCPDRWGGGGSTTASTAALGKEIMHISRTRGLALALAALGLTMAGTQVATAGGAIHQETPVFQFDDGSTVGDATPTRNGHGVTMNISTTVGGELDDFGTLLGVDWTIGDATTVWFVVFNDPEGCIEGCGEDDVLDAIFGDNRADVGVHRAAGHVAGESDFDAGGRLKEGNVDELVVGEPLMDAMTAEIHLVVRSHGSGLTGSELASALHSLNGGCITNTCGDAQAAVFTPPGG